MGIFKYCHILYNWTNIQMSKMIGKPVIKDSSEITNILIDTYLDSFRKRQQNCENKFVIFFNYLTIFCYAVCLVKYCLAFAIEFDFETNLIIFEISVFFGGIQKYNRIVFFFACVLGLYLNIELRLANRNDVNEWTQLFDITKNKVRQVALLDNDFRTRKKLTRLIKHVYRFVSMSFFIIREFSCLFNILLLNS